MMPIRPTKTVNLPQSLMMFAACQAINAFHHTITDIF